MDALVRPSPCARSRLALVPRAALPNCGSGRPKSDSASTERGISWVTSACQWLQAPRSVIFRICSSLSRPPLQDSPKAPVGSLCLVGIRFKPLNGHSTDQLSCDAQIFAHDKLPHKFLAFCTALLRICIDGIAEWEWQEPMTHKKR